MTFYLWAMRTASVILLVIACLTVLASLLMAFSMSQPQPFSPAMNPLALLSAAIASFQNATWPLLGAAALWRADAWLARTGSEPSK